MLTIIDNWPLWNRLIEYMHGIERLTDTEEEALYFMIQESIEVPHARKRLTEAYVWLVLKIADDLHVCDWYNRDGVINTGLLALCKTANKFEVMDGKRFINYAGKTIKGKMWLEMRKDLMSPAKKSPRSTERVVISLSEPAEMDSDLIPYSVDKLELLGDNNAIPVDEQVDKRMLAEKIDALINQVFRKDKLTKSVIRRRFGLGEFDASTFAAIQDSIPLQDSAIHKRTQKGLGKLRRDTRFQRLYKEYMRV